MYFDGIYSEADHPYERNDLNLAVRSINTNIPVDVVLNEDNVVTSATIDNPIWLNENRPYHEITEFINLNSGFEWQIAEKWAARWFGQLQPQRLVPFDQYLPVQFESHSGHHVAMRKQGRWRVEHTPSFDLNNLNWLELECAAHPAGPARGLPEGRAHGPQVGRREVQRQAGADPGQLPSRNHHLGYHQLRHQRWQPSARLAANNWRATASQPATVAVPNAQLADYLQTWTHGPLYSTSDFDVGLNNGWALPNYRLLDAATNIRYFEQEIGVKMARRTGSRGLDAPKPDRRDHRNLRGSEWQHSSVGNLRYNVGVRYIDTEQSVLASSTVSEPRHTDPNERHHPPDPEKQQRLPEVPAELQSGERS